MFGRRHSDESDDLRAFIRDIMARYDRKMERVDARFREADQARERYFKRLEALSEEEARRTDEIIAENRAQRQALLRILDRLDGSGGTAPAG
jgi:hypothetical protein